MTRPGERLESLVVMKTQEFSHKEHNGSKRFSITNYVTASLLSRATGKTIALTIQTFVGKVMPLLFNMLSRFVIAFLQRSKHLLISWL